MSRTKNASRNIVWGILNKIITLGLPFVTRTVMIYTLGMNYVGLGSLFSSILQVLSFAELGIGSALVFSMYKPIAEENNAKVCALLNFYRKTYRIIGIVILVLGLAIMPFLNFLVAGDVPKGINLQILFTIYLANNLVGYFLLAYKQSLFTASQRVDMISKIGMALQVLSSLAQIIILLTIKNYYFYALVIPAITVINNLLVGILTDKAFPQYKCEGNIEKNEQKEIEKKVGGMLFQKIGSIINSSADTIVISSFLGLRILGVYNGYYYVITALVGLIAVIQQSMIPAIGNSIVLDSVEKNLKDFKKFQLLYLWIIVWWSACLLGLYQPFIRLWQGQENMLSNLIVLLLVIYFFTFKMGDVSWMYRESMGLWWECRFIPLITAIVNLVSNIILVNVIGLPGVLISTIVSMSFINLPWNSKVLFLNYFKSTKEWIRFMLRTAMYFLSMVIVSGITLGVCILLPGTGWTNLILRMIVCGIVPNILLILINIKNPEFKSAGQFVLRVFPKKIIPFFVRSYFE